MIVTYNQITDAQLLSSGEYVVAIHYKDANGADDEKHKEQKTEGDIRWISSLSNVTNVYAYSFWYDKNVATGDDMLITSGRIALNGQAFSDSEKWGEEWDHSNYTLSADEKESIKAITRSGGGVFTDIHSVAPDDMREGLLSVYNINGMMVGSSIDGLKPGIYIIRYQQDGVMKSRKISVK